MALQTYPKRLIEVDLPIRRISEHARREKSIRHGHISTLHIWWARRPLAACRAVLCASLWPDPGDKLCPDAFRKSAKEQMLKWAKSDQRLWSAESFPRFNKVQETPDLLNSDVELRKALLDFIADFANWDNSTNEKYLETSRILTQSAHEPLGGIPSTRPLVADPFAGGGSIPLEALRVGADAFASDLNPVAILLNKIVLEYIPKYGNASIEMKDAEGKPIAFNGLAEAVRYWGKWIKQEAESELGQFYPKDPDGSTPVAYLWARTIISEAPDDGTGIPVEIPLMRSMWLAKKGKNSVALRWARNEFGEVQTEISQVNFASGEIKTVKRPKLEIFEPQKASDVESGTVARGSATCPITGYTTPVSSVRKQLTLRKGGATDARLFALVLTRPGQQGRSYRLSTEQDFIAVNSSSEALRKKIRSHSGEFSLFPDEELPIMSGVFNAPIYGHNSWGSLFTQRQLNSMVFIASKIREIIKNQDKSPSSNVIATILALALSRFADITNSLCMWENTKTQIRHLFTRQAIPMLWDFAEGNVLSDAAGNFSTTLNTMLRVIENTYFSEHAGSIENFSATQHALPNDSISAFISDPPYYNAVPYSDLSDFFYVWLKRILKGVHPNLFKSDIAPKDEEACEMAGWDSNRYAYKDKAWYESQMFKAMEEGRRILTPDGIGVIVFAHKSTEGWEAQLQAMLKAGWIFTGSWPIDTELGNRLRAQGSAALASSVHLICRPREHVDGSLIIDRIGDWRDVLAELPKRIHEWMPRLAQEGIVGADAIFACLGPALEIFSFYSSVEKANGEEVPLSEYLEHVWAAVAKEALNMIFEGADTSGFEEDARLTAMWLWTLNTSNNDSSSEDVEEDYEVDGNNKVSKGGFSLEYDAARKIAQGLGAHLEQLTHLVEVKGSEARLLPVGERGTFLFGKQTTVTEEAKGKKKKAKSKQASIFDLFESAGVDTGDAPTTAFTADAIAPDLQISAGKSILDRIHQGMILFATGQGEMLRRFLVDQGIGRDERFWRLAQALSALYPQGTDEKRWVDGVLARKKGLGF